MAWFLCTYKRLIDPDRPLPTRIAAIEDFKAQVVAEGGALDYTEVLGNYAVCKVRASVALLNTIGGTAGFTRIPRVNSLSELMSALTNAQRTAVKNKLNDMGYSDGEILGVLGNLNLSTVTLGQVLRFAASRRLTPRFDSIQDQFVLDGAFVACRSVDSVDVAVSD